MSKIVDILIDSIAYRGVGVGRSDGCVYFVPGTCPGERVRVCVVKEKKTYGEARVVSIENPSSDRIKPNCRIANDILVPGCVYDHVSHEAELSYKNDQLKSFLSRQAKLPNVDSLMLDPYASEQMLNYRNKITLHYDRDERGKMALGYYGEDNETIVDIHRCPLACNEINDELSELRRDPRFTRYLGRGGSAILRHTEEDGVAVIPLSSYERDEEEYPYLHFDSVIGKVKVPVRGFYQVNPYVSQELVKYVGTFIKEFKPDRLLDFYCGVGVFGLYGAKLGVDTVVGYDSGRDVIEAANINVKDYSLNNAKFICGLSAQIADNALKNAKKRGGKTMAIVDPPRTGLEKETVEALWEHPVDNLVYVSCGPDTLARDLLRLCSDGTYSVVNAKLFDMFPRTSHFETVVLMLRVK